MASTSATVRSATPDDAAGIAHVHVRGWQAGYRGLLPEDLLTGMSAPEALERRTAVWAQHLETGLDVAVAVDDADQVLSFASSGPSRDEDAADGTGELFGLYADPDAWGSGVGFAAHREALQRLARSGSTSATLWVLERNERGRRFYERQGWTLDTSPGSLKTEEVSGVELVEVRYRRDLADLAWCAPAAPASQASRAAPRHPERGSSQLLARDQGLVR